MAGRDGRDSMDVGKKVVAAATAKPGQALGTSLPSAEPTQSPAAQRDSLKQSIEELEGALRYMGTSHPKRTSMENKVRELRDMLTHLEKLGG